MWFNGEFLVGQWFRYFAPEYFMHGIVDEKTDVFAFGVLLLELITGHPALDESQQSLVLWVSLTFEAKYRAGSLSFYQSGTSYVSFFLIMVTG